MYTKVSDSDSVFNRMGSLFSSVTAKSSSLTTEVGTQTSSELLHGQDVTADSVGVKSESKATEAGTQTCYDFQRTQSLSCNSDGTEKLLQNLNELLLSGLESDVTLNVKGKEFKSHKAILASRSPVFANMFGHEMVEQSSGSVQITDCNPDVFHGFLLYLYTGNVDKLNVDSELTVDSVVELYCIADKYDVKGLIVDCVQFLLSSLSVESFCATVSLALRHCEQELLDSANKFFAENVKQIMATDEWKTFIMENPAEANELFFKALNKLQFLSESNES